MLKICLFTAFIGHLPRLAPKQAADLGCGAGRNAGEMLKLQRH